jgi:hypothetical protein
MTAVAVVAGVLVAGCGGGDDETQAAAETPKQARAEEGEGAGKVKPGTAPAIKTANPDEAQYAAAVADAKTTAPVDLVYDIPVKPEVGQSFEIELAAKPRLPADTLDVEIGESPGITIEGERATRFPNVEAGELYKFTVRASGAAEGLYYVTVITTMSTKVQSEGRAFSVPVVIGTPPAAQKTEPQKDAAGQAVEPMPAK